MKTIDPVSLGIMWDRLISITDEVLSALVRTSFSSNVRDSYDLSVLLFSANGMSLAQGTYSVPSFTGTGPATLRHMLDRFPADTLRPGDVIVTNDPWMGTGHLYDINVMAPVFRRGRLCGYSMSITHLPDMTGFLAWIIWVALHIATLLGNRNRFATMINLSSKYLFSGSHNAIVGETPYVVAQHRIELTPHEKEEAEKRVLERRGGGLRSLARGVGGGRADGRSDGTVEDAESVAESTAKAEALDAEMDE